MELITDNNIRLIVGFMASTTLLALIVLDALSPVYELQTTTIYLLTILIWGFLGVDVLQRNLNSDSMWSGSDDSDGDTDE